MHRIGIDTGGTFTDVVSLKASGLRVHKLPSTPRDPAAAVLDGLAQVRSRAAVDVVHGSTVGLNAILTGRVARTAFVTNEGFADLIEIGRQDRTGLYALHPERPMLPVPRKMRFEVSSRRDAAGRILAKPSARELRELCAALQRSGAESIAIGLLHSYAHPEDEREIAEALRGLAVPITCSAELLPAHREYERFSSAILNAAIAPVMGSYLDRLARDLERGQLRLMRSSGGIMGSAEARRFPARAVLSGPAGGVVACRELARRLQLGSVAAFDMGGTSTDVCLVTPDGSSSNARTIAGLSLATPAVDVHTIGCGGGSIARVDAGGALVVGPESAGADPGPACYGRGDRPTVTDAHMVLGHMGGDTLLGGDFPVDPDLSARAVEKLGKRLGLGLRRTAEGILEVAEVAMARALLVITVEQAVDPSSVPIIAYGGAGGLHAASLMRRLSTSAVIPPFPGTFSAIGLALAGESHETARPVLQPIERLAARDLKRLANELKRGATKSFAGGRSPRVRIDARLRFTGQGEGLWVPMQTRLERAFRREHQRVHGFEPAEAEVELLELRAVAHRGTRKLPDSPRALSHNRGTMPHRRPLCGGSPWRIHARSELGAGSRLRGPCLVSEATAVTVIPRGIECVARGSCLHLRRVTR